MANGAPNPVLNQYDRLGFQGPFYTRQNGRLRASGTFEEAVSVLDRRMIDAAAIFEFANRGHFLAQRTVFEGVARNPWMAKLSESDKWTYADLPEHGDRRADPVRIAAGLTDLLRAEVSEVCAGLGSCCRPVVRRNGQSNRCNGSVGPDSAWGDQGGSGGGDLGHERITRRIGTPTA